MSFRCENEIVFLKEGYWGTMTEHDELFTITCPPRYCKCNGNQTKIGCAFNFRNPDLQCLKGRIGTLCGKCQNGTGLNIMTSECVPCNGFSWSVLILFVVATGVIIAAILIVVLNPRFSSHMRGILFFVQMLPYVCDPSSKVSKIVLTITAWVDLGGSNSIPVSGCFLKQMNSLYMISLGYLYPSLIFIVLMVLFILHKLYLITFRRNSPFQSFWILIVAMYKFLVETSFLLLFCVPVKGKYVSCFILLFFI